MHLHILGICGTFMGSLALLARELGHTVTGSDQNVYPPMSTQLEAAGIALMQGYSASHLQPHPDVVIVGNAMKRGIDAVEYMLNQGLPYTSGPQFLSDYVLRGRHVLAVAGTHGKTTTTTMLAWILDQAGLNPGFLIGGVPLCFSHSARLGGHSAQKNNAHDTEAQKNYFVVEADEYDSAFFDKRSKFVHYQPRTAILNNLEFDHADIFDDLAAIQKQFHHLVRTIPSQGQIITPITETHIDEVLEMGCWSPVQRTAIGSAETALADWQAELINPDGSQFKVFYQGKDVGSVNWTMTGQHSVSNGLAAIAAAHHVAVAPQVACDALSNFAGIKRRMELLATINGIEVYDDFAHHPTAIETTLDGARKKIGERKLWAIIEPRSNTMRMGSHKDNLAHSARMADQVMWYQPEGMDWDLSAVVDSAINSASIVQNLDDIVARIQNEAASGDVVVVMSNGGFGGLHQKIIAALNAKYNEN